MKARLTGNWLRDSSDRRTARELVYNAERFLRNLSYLPSSVECRSDLIILDDGVAVPLVPEIKKGGEASGYRSTFDYSKMEQELLARVNRCSGSGTADLVLSRLVFLGTQDGGIIRSDPSRGYAYTQYNPGEFSVVHKLKDNPEGSSVELIVTASCSPIRFRGSADMEEQYVLQRAGSTRRLIVTARSDNADILETLVTANRRKY